MATLNRERSHLSSSSLGGQSGWCITSNKPTTGICNGEISPQMTGLENQWGWHPGDPKCYPKKIPLLKGSCIVPFSPRPSEKTEVWKVPWLDMEEICFLIWKHLLKGQRTVETFWRWRHRQTCAHSTNAADVWARSEQASSHHLAKTGASCCHPALLKQESMGSYSTFHSLAGFGRPMWLWFPHSQPKAGTPPLNSWSLQACTVKIFSCRLSEACKQALTPTLSNCLTKASRDAQGTQGTPWSPSPGGQGGWYSWIPWICNIQKSSSW